MSSGSCAPYSEYNDSQRNWLGEIPSHWSAFALKFLSSERVKDGPHETPNFVDEGIPFFSVDGIQDNELVLEGCRFISEPDHERYSQKCRPATGDVLLGKAASVGKVAHVQITQPFNVWSPLAVIRPRDERMGRYIYYSIQSAYLQAQCLVQSNSNTQNNLSMRAIDNLYFPAPPVEEQTQIAKFLDYETAKIDALIEKQQQLIALLKEKRQAVISHAVTKGLNPDAPMRDSGVEWLGEVPAHWTVGVKLAQTADGSKGSFVNGPFGSDLLASELTDAGVPVIYIRDFKPSGYSRKSTVCVSLQKAKQLDVCRVDSGDVLVAKVGDPPGDACVYPENEPSAVITQDVIRIRLENDFVNPDYLTHLLNSDFGRAAVDNISVESTRKRVALGDYKQLRLSLPPIKEQGQIASSINARLKVLDALISKSETGIELIRERRTALISAAVTGKIDARGWKPPESKPQTEAA